MTLTQERKAEIVAQFGANAQDTGNTRVQVALLTAADQRPHRAPARAQGGPPLPPRAAHARRPAPPPPELPPEQRPRGLPRPDPRARPAPVALGIIAAGTPAPEFTLKREDGGDFTQADLLGPHDGPRLLPVRLQRGLHRPAAGLRGGARRAPRAQGAVMYGVSTDATPAQSAFREKLGVRSSSSRTSSPRARRRAPSAPTSSRRGMTNRALVVVGPEGVVAWSHLADSPGDLPGGEPHLRRPRRRRRRR